jgi:hypothetical protein
MFVMRFDFLVSSERSGTNLLVRLLNKHSLVCGPSPTHLVRTFVRNRNIYGDLRNDHNWETLLGDAAAVFNNQLGKWATSWSVDKLRDCVPERNLTALIRTIYETEAAVHGKKRLFLKENHAATLIPFYLCSFPGGRFIHLVRDPRDVALSWKRSNNHPGGVMQASRVWQRDQAEALMASGGLYDSNQFMTLRYEDLIKVPELSLRKICTFLDLEFEGDMLNFHEDSLTRDNATRIQDWANLSRPLMKTNSAKYGTGLSKSENLWIEMVCHAEMQRFGYMPEYSSDEAPNYLERQIEELERQIHLEKQSSHEDSGENLIRQKRLEVIRRIASRSSAVCSD